MVYQLKYLPKIYKALQLDIMTIVEQLGDYGLISKLMNAPLTGDSLAKEWQPIATSLQSLAASGTEEPDISLWDSQGLYLSAKAYDALAADLKHEGEFLPITVDGQQAYLFNCQSFAAEDRSLTVRNYLDGEPDGVRSLVFDNADIANNNRCLFRSKLQGCTALYASEKFRLLCEMHKLCGLQFEADLLDSFE